MENVLTLNLPTSRFLSLKWKISLKFFWILGFILIITLLILYIFQLNLLFSQTYLIQNYEKKLEQLSKENAALEINSIQANSLETIESQIKELGFEKIENIEYIKVLENRVVRSNENKE